MENPTDEQITAAIYEPPALVELGEFSDDTLGYGEPAPVESYRGYRV